eukprot:577038-Lingulodinium_polyedra.AAC.1
MLREVVETKVRTWSRHCEQRERTHLAFASPGGTRRGAGVQRGLSMGHMPRSSSAVWVSKASPGRTRLLAQVAH